MKRIFVFLLALLPFVCNAQMKLELSEIENAGNVYACEDRNEMKAIFYCDSSMVLTFKSGYDDIISLNEVLEGERKSYELVFPTDGKGTSYDGRLLEIYCDGFDVFNMFEFNFPKSTLKEYKVTNRYVKAKNPYFKSVYSGDDLFANSLYEEAKHQYLISKEYPEYETYKESIDSKIQAIDSILVWRERGEKLFSESKYLEAYRYYTAIMKLNPGDKSVYMKTMECSSRYRSDCDIYFSMAEDLYYNKERKSALEYYKKVVEMGCPNATAANEKILLINGELNALKNHERFLVYEWNPDINIGLSVGRCRMRKAGGYFSARVNPDIFNFPKSKKDPQKYGEANVSLGFTAKIVKPVWIFAGLGYTGGGSFVEYKDEYYDNDEIQYRLDWYSSVSPEAGIIVKFWYVSLKYTFQYRYTFNDKSKSVLGNNMHFIGAGICW